jgi:hypothetical protein
MGWVLALLLSCVVDDDPFGGGGAEGTPTGGGATGGSDDSGGDGGTDDTAPTDCTDAELEWSTLAQNDSSSTPFYSGDSITFWGYVENPCAEVVSLSLQSTCLFDVVTLQPPNGAAMQEAIVPGCTTTSQVVELGAHDLLPEAYTWGPLYVAGQYGYGLRATTPDERVLVGSFTIQ